MRIGGTHGRGVGSNRWRGWRHLDWILSHDSMQSKSLSHVSMVPWGISRLSAIFSCVARASYGASAYRIPRLRYVRTVETSDTVCRRVYWVISAPRQCFCVTIRPTPVFRTGRRAPPCPSGAGGNCPVGSNSMGAAVRVNTGRRRAACGTVVSQILLRRS